MSARNAKNQARYLGRSQSPVPARLDPPGPRVDDPQRARPIPRPKITALNTAISVGVQLVAAGPREHAPHEIGRGAAQRETPDDRVGAGLRVRGGVRLEDERRREQRDEEEGRQDEGVEGPVGVP